jgi:DNA-binding CsgD family transcriptional regulator
MFTHLHHLSNYFSIQKNSITEMSYKEIAEKMFCSPRTVESYRDALFEKLGLKSRVGLAVYAMKNGFATN